MNSRGNIDPNVYLNNSDPSVRTTGFEALIDAAAITAGGSGVAPHQAQGEVAYVVEAFFSYPEVGFLHTTAGGAYARFIFQ
jgi:hypothetical protein